MLPCREGASYYPHKQLPTHTREPFMSDTKARSRVFQFRLYKEEYDRLEQVAEKVHWTKPELLRYLINALPDPEDVEMPRVTIKLKGNAFIG